MTPTFRETVVYKKVGSTDLILDITRPAGPHAGQPARPCMLFFHGGGWRSGSPRKFLPFTELLAANGIVGMSVEYRLMTDDDLHIPKEAIDDARSAMRWVKANATQLGCDPMRIGAGGSSAGGHLALMTSMKPPSEDPTDDLKIDPRPAALILMSAPLNFDDYPSPVPLETRRLYSPYQLLTAGNLPPTLLIYGTADKKVPFRQALQFRDKAASLGLRDVQLLSYEGRKHSFVNKDPADFRSVGDAMLAFLRRLGW